MLLLKKICKLFLKCSPIILGPIFLLFPSLTESPYNYFELYSLLLAFILFWFLTLKISNYLILELPKFKKYLFSLYAFISILIVLACLSLLRERLKTEVFILFPLLLAISSLKEFSFRQSKTTSFIFLSFICDLIVGSLSCLIYIGSFRWQILIISLALALQISASRISDSYQSRDSLSQNILSFYAVCLIFPAVLISSLSYTHMLSSFYLITLLILFPGSQLIQRLKQQRFFDEKSTFYNDFLGCLYVVLCLVSGVL